MSADLARACFVTATGTGVGKTFVTAGLARWFRAHGKAVEVYKPVMSGFDPAQAQESDAGMLLQALGRPGAVRIEEIAAISPFRFRAPLSPDMAARAEGRTLDFDALVKFSTDAIEAARGTVLIEGVGGVMVPLDARRTVLDWIVALGAPALLVAGSYLGTLSHTLTAVAVLRARGVRIAGIVVSETPESTVGLAETVETIARFAAPVPVFALPYAAGGHAEPAAFAPVAAALLRGDGS